MANRTITVYEHTPIAVGDGATSDGLTADEARVLQEIAELRPGFCERGYRSLKLAQYCGIVAVGDRVIEILPKVDAKADPAGCRGMLLRLLREADRFPVFTHLPVGHHVRQAPLLDVFISAFMDEVTRIAQGGLLMEYQELEEDLPVVRGQIRAARQFATAGNRPDQVSCRFDELTADNGWNRLVKAGLRAVRPWIAGVELGRRWIELFAVFDDVADARPEPRTFERLRYDRKAKRYQPSIEWVRLILSLLSPDLRAGSQSAPALLFDMNLLFENAVASMLGRRLARGDSLVVQESTHALAAIQGTNGRRAFALKPDLVVKRAGKTVAIGDTKWKRLEVKRGCLRPKEADMYQMHAYASSLGCDRLSLIYPWHAGLDGTEDITFELPKAGANRPAVSVVCLDLDDDPITVVRGGGDGTLGSLLKVGSQAQRWTTDARVRPGSTDDTRLP